jgi:hypothetical protein
MLYVYPVGILYVDYTYNCRNQYAEEVPTFERTWEERAKSLPQWNRTRPHTIGAPHGKLVTPIFLVGTPFGHGVQFSQEVGHARC